MSLYSYFNFRIETKFIKQEFSSDSSSSIERKIELIGSDWVLDDKQLRDYAEDIDLYLDIPMPVEIPKIGNFGDCFKCYEKPIDEAVYITHIQPDFNKFKKIETQKKE